MRASTCDRHTSLQSLGPKLVGERELNSVCPRRSAVTRMRGVSSSRSFFRHCRSTKLFFLPFIIYSGFFFSFLYPRRFLSAKNSLVFVTRFMKSSEWELEEEIVVDVNSRCVCRIREWYLWRLWMVGWSSAVSDKTREEEKQRNACMWKLDEDR